MTGKMITSFNSSSSNGTKGLDYFTKCDDYPLGFRFWSWFSVFSFVLGFPVNLILIRELLHRHRLKVKTDLFMINLTVMDLLFIAIMPLSVCNFMTWHNMVFEFIVNVIYGLSLSSRPLFMACICVDCYFAVVHPITYMTNKASRIIRKVVFIIIWVFSWCFSLYMALTPWAFTTTLFIVPFIISLPAITFCDVSILHALRPSANHSIHPQKKRAFHAIVNSFAMTFIVYLPPLFIFSFGAMMPISTENYKCTLAMFGLSFSMAGCVIMPILYLDTLGKLDLFKVWWTKIFLALNS